MPPQSVTHYEVLEKLGQGGMGEVYKARDLRLQRFVALKFLSPELLNSPQARARFLREGQALSSLSHPHIATVFDVDESDGSPFLALEYLPGGTLKRRIRSASSSGRFLEMKDVIEWGAGVAEGLAHAHRHGVIHRDVKGSNVMFDAEGRVKLTDFGLAKVTHVPEVSAVGTVAGTFAYMSPEQISGERVDQRSDLFSLGVVLYEMTTGKLPFPGESPAEVMNQVLHRQPAPAATVRPELPEAFEGILRRLLAKSPAARYSRAEDVARELRAFQPASGSESEAPTVTQVVAPWWRRQRRWILAALVVLLAVILTGTRDQIRRWVHSWTLPAQKHVAVLPFRSIGGDASQQAFCDGLTETLTTALTKHGDLSVVPPTESRRVESVEEARREFGVNLVVYGSVQRRGEQVRLIISLIDAERQRQIDSQPIDWPLSRLNELEEGVLAKVADLLNVVMTRGPEGTVAAGATQMPAAYDAYLRGRGFLYRYDRPGNLERALQEFEDAARRDARFALAYVGLAETQLRIYRLQKQPEILLAARAEAERAVELNPNLASGRLTLGAVLAEGAEPEKAAQEMEAALRLDPRDPAAYRELANLFGSQRRLREAERVLQRAIDSRPGDWLSYLDMGTFYFGQHRYRDAERLYRKVRDLVPDSHLGYRNLGVTLVRLGRNREAEAELRKSVALRPAAIGYSNLGALLMFEGRHREAVEIMEKAAELAPVESPNNFRLWGNLGDAYWLAGGDMEKARAAWRRAAETAERQLTGMPSDADLLGYLAKYHAKAGDAKEAIGRIEAALKRAPASATVRYQAALVHTLLGRREQALRELARAIDQGYSVSEIRMAPELAPLRSDPRYEQLINRGGRR